MGSVKCLLEYFQYKNQFKTCHLYKSNLVIDGDSLAKYLYHKADLKCHKTDCLSLHVEIKYFFKQLRTCLIKPIIIFNGPSKPRLQKYDINQKRFQKTKHTNKKHPLPLLLVETLKASFRKFGIQHYTSEIESIHEIVFIANQLKAPVLSNNNEFLVYQINKGIIPIQTLKSKLIITKSIFFYATNKCKLNCKKFNSSKIKINWHTKFKPQYLPIFATLCGNEIVDEKLLKPLYEKLDIAKLNKLDKMNYLFNYLNGKRNLQILLKSMKTLLRGHLKLRKLIHVSLQEYSIPKKINKKNNYALIQSKALEVLPRPIVNYLVNGYLSPNILNGFISGSVYSNQVIKLKNSPSIYEITRNIRRDIYCNLMKYFPSFNELVEYNVSYNIPLIIMRQDLNLYELAHPPNTIKISSHKEYLLSLLREYLKVKMKNNKNNIWIIKLIWWTLHYEYHYVLSKSLLSNKSRKLKILFDESENSKVVNFLNEFKLFYFYFNQLILLRNYNDTDLADFIIAPYELFDETWELVFLNVDIKDEYELCEYLLNEVNYRSGLMRQLVDEFVY